MNTEPPIPLLPADIEEPADLVAAIRQRRGGELLKLDRMLLHSPALAEGWNAYLGAVRTGLSVPLKLRELAMCGVAILNGAEYEFEHHSPIFIEAGGTPEQALAIRQIDSETFPVGLFPELEQDVLALTREMTRDIRVAGALKRRLVRALGVQQTVELVAVVATYNMVSRFLVALSIESEHRGDGPAHPR
ncbi:MAG: carboxymuconolactone decarboxylase family protein [Betaproteobacteria bacterium]|nr:carboxymuconolactone decarboxylase family protein [Betaproteobacteria bacterium]NBT75920.1 carboxymuconolactone decarboxylase family protein [Betaproteobacteria bacterium]NBY14013.1 carboxymuconolactone decarboxylase family protein [Betaproteobacteria bacterium]NCA16651.1 carboxymuconolactone decarboxylase family protein [Betaproteobacteria bacterium]NDF03983.1 carboxymuconolactone decarboxylase family protein [Betaproteobacteria bacterium]